MSITDPVLVGSERTSFLTAHFAFWAFCGRLLKVDHCCSLKSLSFHSMKR